jgi:hypothetical protein
MKVRFFLLLLVVFAVPLHDCYVLLPSLLNPYRIIDFLPHFSTTNPSLLPFVLSLPIR